MNKGLDLIQRQELEIIDGFPTGNIFIGVASDELTELEQELKEYEQYKTIEKEIGIDLITLVKALKNGIRDEQNHSLRIELCLNHENQWVISLWDTKYSVKYFEVKDYGKTWALTREELE